MSIDSLLTKTVHFSISNISLNDAAKIVLFNFKMADISANNMLKSAQNDAEIIRKTNSAYNSRLAAWIEANNINKADNSKNILLSIRDMDYSGDKNKYYFAISYNSNYSLRGTQYIRYSSGQIAIEFDYNRGELNGRYIKYYPSGHIWLEGIYNGGIRYGKFIRYYNYPQNSIYKIQYWNDNKPYGIHSEFHRNMQVRERIIYDNNGIAYYSGDKHVIYHDDGSIEAEIPVKDGQLHGRFVHKYKDGVIKIWGCYNRGKRAGPYFEYDETGKETAFIQYNSQGERIIKNMPNY
jgi:antitoxin component YwqK of YwqJK toxin-antitoxin module